MMSNIRDSQLVIEIVNVIPSPALRDSQLAVEVVNVIPNPAIRVSQLVIEILHKPPVYTPLARYRLGPRAQSS